MVQGISRWSYLASYDSMSLVGEQALVTTTPNFLRSKSFGGNPKKIIHLGLDIDKN
jgi:hypothetical protein